MLIIERNRRGRPPKYPFDILEIGESFFISNIKNSQFQSTMRYWNSRDTRQFVITSRESHGGLLKENGVTGIRITRVM